jgi:hypothetical protein
VVNLGARSDIQEERCICGTAAEGDKRWRYPAPEIKCNDRPL